MAKSTPNRVRILDVPIDSLTITQAVRKLTEEAADAKSPARMVTKPYVEFLDTASRNPEVAQLFDRAWLNLPDGVALQWAATYLYGGPRALRRWLWLSASIVLRPTAITTVLPEKLGGTTFTWPLLTAAAKANLKLFLVGSPRNGIQPTLDAIQARVPGLTVVGTFPGELAGLRGESLAEALRDPANTPEAELLAAIKHAKPDLVLVGMGFPLQETVIARLIAEVDHGIFVGEGGTFDFDSFGGSLRKAPTWMQRGGLEWLWRLILQPQRLSRQLAIPRFMVKTYRYGRELDRLN